jgi:hypothetical protein
LLRRDSHADSFDVVAINPATSFDRGAPEGDLMELNGWTSRQILRRYGARVRAARARRTYDHMGDNP